LPRIHPKPELLEGLTGALPEARRRILRHLHTCDLCAAGSASPRRDRVVELRPRESDYETVVDRVLRDFRPRLAAAEREQEEAPFLLAELLRQPAERRRLLVHNSRRFRSFGLCGHILEHSREETPSAPQRGEDLAALALELAEEIEPGGSDAARIEDVRAKGWMLIGNARRVRSDFHGAELAFLRAEAHLRRGTRDHLDHARLLVLRGVLRRWQSRVPEAVRLFRRAVSIWLTAGDTRSAVEALTSWALVHEDEGETDQAIRLLRGATAVAGPDLEPRLRLMLQHNLAVCLVDQGRFLEAQAVLARSRALYCAVQDPAVSLRRQWLEATIAGELGQRGRSLHLLKNVRNGFLDLGNGYEPALVSLHLALLHLDTGHFAAAEELAWEALEVFRSQRVVRDCLAAMILIRQAAARQPASLAS